MVYMCFMLYLFQRAPKPITLALIAKKWNIFQLLSEQYGCVNAVSLFKYITILQDVY